MKGTTNHGNFYEKKGVWKLTSYTDSDWDGNQDDRKSTFGYVFTLGLSVISWSSKKQPIFAFSSVEEEYVAATSATCQVVWLRRMLQALLQPQMEEIVIFCDNQSTIAFSKNLVFHGGSKHIDIKFHFIRELVKSNEIKLSYYRSKDQFADILTKPLKEEDFNRLKNLLGMTSCPTNKILGRMLN